MKFLWKSQWKKLAVFSLAAVFLAVNLKAMAEEAESRRLSVLSVQGDEAFVIKGSSREVKAVGGMPLGQGSQLRTGMKTSMYLEADSDKVIKMDSSTLVEISKASSKKLKISLKSGEIFFNVDKPLASGEEMSFDAAQTSMSIRGTSGILEVQEGGLELSLIEGHVEWDIGNQTVSINPGERVSLKKISGEALDRNGMNSAYELWKTGNFDWRDLDAMGLEAVLEQKDHLDLSAIGLHSEAQLEEAQERSRELREDKDRQEEEQRRKEEQDAARGKAGSGGSDGSGIPAGVVRLDQEPAEDSDSGDHDAIDLITPTETAPEETKPEETKPSETEPSETEPSETTPAETKPDETKPFTPPADAKDGENGNLFVKEDGTQTWYYYEAGRGTYNSVGKWEWFDSFLVDHGLIGTP